MNTTDALIGVGTIGAGVLIGYAAYRGVPVFGPSGLLTEAIRTGKLQAIPPNAPTTPKGKTSGG